ncbi:MAG: DegT/DnrJ/EryC1/StrS family aminotransferase [Candidatus Hydrogenedentota bacterium]
MNYYMITFTNLIREYNFFKKDINNCIKKVLKKGNYILGYELQKFEEEFSSFHKVKYGIGVANCTDGLELCLKALGVKAKDEVITPANTAIPTGMAILNAGATPVFCDVNENDLLMNPIELKKLITKKTKAIIPVHLYGAMADMRKIIEIADGYNIPVIEDAAQAHGSKRDGIYPGQISKAASFSFYPTKNLGCYGDGGMILTNDKRFMERLKLLRNYGQPDRYYSTITGQNSRLDELQAAILRVKLKKLNYLNKLRIKIANRYRTSLKDYIDFLDYISSCKPVYHLLVARVKDRDKFIEYMKSKKIQVFIHYPLPLHKQPPFKNRYKIISSLKVTEAVVNNIVSLPISPFLSELELNYIIKSIKSFYETSKS